MVLDTSAAIRAMAVEDPPERLIDRMEGADLAHAPHLIDVEFLAALRGLVLGRRLSVPEAEAAGQSFGELPIARYPHHPLAARIWQLRQALTPYDAAFVALAEDLDLPLVTCDGRLARSKGHGAEIELYG